MIFAILLAIQTTADTAVENFACEYLATNEAKSHEPPRADLRLLHNVGNDTWSVEWPGKPPMAAEKFPTELSSMGEAVAIRWQEMNGSKQAGFILFSDVGDHRTRKVAWLGLGKPSLWDAPGYICAAPIGSAQESK